MLVPIATQPWTLLAATQVHAVDTPIISNKAMTTATESQHWMPGATNPWTGSATCTLEMVKPRNSGTNGVVFRMAGTSSLPHALRISYHQTIGKRFPLPGWQKIPLQNKQRLELRGMDKMNKRPANILSDGWNSDQNLTTQASGTHRPRPSWTAIWGTANFIVPFIVARK